MQEEAIWPIKPVTPHRFNLAIYQLKLTENGGGMVMSIFVIPPDAFLLLGNFLFFI